MAAIALSCPGAAGPLFTQPMSLGAVLGKFRSGRAGAAPLLAIPVASGASPIADVRVLRHRTAMTWLAEIIVQGLWEGAVEVAYRRWGWIGGAVVLLGPFIIGGLVLWGIFK